MSIKINIQFLHIRLNVKLNLDQIHNFFSPKNQVVFYLKDKTINFTFSIKIKKLVYNLNSWRYLEEITRKYSFSINFTFSLDSPKKKEKKIIQI